MKKLMIIGIIALGAGLSAFKSLNTKSQSDVNQVDGLFVFVESKPIAEYEKLGDVKSTFGSGTQYIQVRDRLISKAKKEYPNADGIILHFVTNGTDKATVIKFKD